MRALQGLGCGALVGLGAGIATAFFVALLSAAAAAIDPNGDPWNTVIGISIILAIVGSIVGGGIGACVGAVLGFILGVGGWHQQAKWVAPGLLMLTVGAVVVNDVGGRSDPLVLAGAAAIALGLAAIGFGAGVAFERLMTNADEPLRPADPFRQPLHDVPVVW